MPVVVKLLTLAGLACTLMGALILAIGDAVPGRVTWATNARGNPNRLGWIGFLFIMLGTSLQIVAVTKM